jgi:uncharacterized protein (DUF2461 family)
MPIFLQDPSPSLYLTLGILAVIILAIWANRQSHANLRRALIIPLLLAIIAAIDYTHQSPREEAIFRIQTLARLSRDFQPEGFEDHLTANFQFQGMNRAKFVNAWRLLRQHYTTQWQGASVWDFSRENFQQLNETTVRIGFSGQAQGYPQTLHYIQADFTRQPNGTHLVTTFHFFDPIQRDNGPERQIPLSGR